MKKAGKTRFFHAFFAALFKKVIRRCFFRVSRETKSLKIASRETKIDEKQLRRQIGVKSG